MIGIFSALMLVPKSYHDNGVFHAGVVQSKSAYEEDFYPALKTIDYQGFVRE